jgi:type I restriction enzyme R subunit
MNEAETRAELIDPKLRACGWGVVEGSRVLREFTITAGRIQTGGRGKREIADYVLVYKGIKLAVIEAKSAQEEVGEGVMQAKKYAQKLQLETTYSTNGRAIYQMCMKSGTEGLVDDFLSPQQLWEKTFPPAQVTATNPAEREAKAGTATWREHFAEVPFEDKSGSWQPRYYQEIAVQRVVEAIANGKERILLTLATGTGKTAIAFQIAWKLFQTRWNLMRDGSRRPRILFLADRNILADQAYNAFSSFPDDALVRIKPNEIKKSGKVPTNGSVFFTIFQTFMSGTDSEGKPAPYFGEYPSDYFDFIIIDECHRGGANDESTWRNILEYFSPAVQLGLTATPKRQDNVDTYRYFGDPVYIYSLKEGINDGFLTPFKVKRIQTTLDDYRYTSDDTVLEGEIEEGRLYEEKDFNRTIEITARESKRVSLFLAEADPREKAILFCANQAHAALIRDLVNQLADTTDPFYCVRVTANDGEEGERMLREFQDNEKTIPTILTTSQKLSTGVDARNIRSIVLLRPVNSMIEFKQIVGRGTRLFDGKEFFTIYDYVDAYRHFSDPEWDGEPLNDYEEPGFEPGHEYTPRPPRTQPADRERRQKIKVALRRGKEREIKHMVSTSFWSADGRPISAEEFLQTLFGELPKLFKDEHELRRIWSNPITRRTLLEKLEEAGFPKSDLLTLQKLVDMEKSDLYDVLEYVFNGDYVAMTREARAQAAEATIFALMNENQKEFIAFVLSKYIETGVEELDQEKLPILLTNKYQSLEDARNMLGDVSHISKLFIEFQQHLYNQGAA